MTQSSAANPERQVLEGLVHVGADGAWSMWADPARIGLWWHTTDTRLAAPESVDPRSGGHLTLHLEDPDGTVVASTARITASEPCRHLVFEFEDNPVRQVSVEFIEQHSTLTRVLVTLDAGDRFSTLFSAAVSEWSEMLDRMRTACERADNS